MLDTIRDAAVGQVIRFITRNKYLKYPEEEDGYQLPAQYKLAEKSGPMEGGIEETDESSITEIPEGEKEEREEAEKPEEHEEMEKLDTVRSRKSTRSTRSARSLHSVPSHVALSRSHTQQDLERHISHSSLKKSDTQIIHPTVTNKGDILVDWYDTDDPANPQNWGSLKKGLIALLIGIYTTAVYMGSSIYTASEQAVTEIFHVSVTAASLGLALYVLAYGLGPMLWSPLSEIPLLGRNPPYVATFAIFTILCLPTALVNNFAGLLVLRFLQGFFGSPCLATGGASLADMYSLLKFPYVLSLWAFSATCGPALGPLISGFSVAAEDWRWSLWEMLWLAGPAWLVMFFFLPETFAANILLRRAKRLRKLTGNPAYKSQSELDQKNMSVSAVAFDSLIKPFQLNIQDPSVAFTSVYIALCYGIYYSFFEVFPFVYNDIYGFNLGEEGLAFLSITVGVIIAIAIYWAYLWFVVEPEMIANGPGAPERRLIPALVASFLLPIGLFIFAWTARADIHWIVTIIGLAIFSVGIFIVIQCIFVYLPMTYPQYAASLFAGNDLLRSAFAAGAILFSRPMYLKLGIGKGTSLLASLTAGCIAGVFVLWMYGHKLRARSRFAVKPAATE
ncbi:MAG: hypothetical protein M1828_000539 [Chrysothrix sp. TS-e1954]|nr:MAG: hypothetical protein M1828_000539 [Chrysothrix sp. TS-e1954]